LDDERRYVPADAPALARRAGRIIRTEERERTMAQAAGDDSVLADVDVSYLASKAAGDEYKILVARTSPEDPMPPGQVLIVTDAQLLYGTALEMTRQYRMSGLVPPLLVVGVGYPGARYFRETHERRIRDLTPTQATEPESAGKGGGAPAFLAFIETELKPYLGERYEVAAAEYALFGFSLGGLFAAWVLLTKPEAFRRYGIGSPSCWWAGKSILDTEAAYARTHDDLRARVFIGVGQMENAAGALHAAKWQPAEKRAKAYDEAEADRVDMVSDAALLASRLERRRYPGLELEHKVFASEYHETVGAVHLSWSLRSLFDAPR
jgi:uncharacterized protein